MNSTQSVRSPSDICGNSDKQEEYISISKRPGNGYPCTLIM
jgi:hypothetical protein